MKTTITLFVTLFTCAIAIAQPTLNLGGMPGFGTTIRTSAVNAAGISPGAAGANQTWNFTAYPDTGAIDSFTFVNPATTPFASTYPSATTAFINESDTTSVYGYFKESSAAFELLGVTLSDANDDFVTVYTNPQMIYGFPSSYNSTFTDVYRSFADYPALGATFVSNGTMNYVVDGYGTLITTSGTYPNTIRIKKRELSTDSTLTDFGDFISESRGTSYEWVTVAPGASFGIWNISTDTTEGTFGQPDNYSQSVTHTRGNFATTGIQQTHALSLTAFPNPASDNVMFLLPKDARVSLLDLSGRLVQTQSFVLTDGSMPIMDVSWLPAGTYLIEADGQGYSSFGKLIIAH
jgi:hypothetical protein